MSLSAALFFGMNLDAGAKAEGEDTYVISGTVTFNGTGLPNVVMSGLAGDPATDAAGFYTATVDSGWSGTVTPILAGYGFNPDSTTYANVVSDQINDYQASSYYFTDEIYDIPADLAKTLNTVVPIDFDHDGDLDILFTQMDIPSPPDPFNPSPTLAYRNDGTGHFTEVTSQVIGGLMTLGAGDFVVGDFNGDGLDDACLPDMGSDREPWEGATMILLMQTTDGRLINEANSRLPVFAIGEHPYNIEAGDIDNDGDVDLVVSNTGGNYYCLINDATGNFVRDETRLPSKSNYYANNCRLMDVNKDNSLDLFMGDEGGNQDRDFLLFNDGTGHYSFADNSALPPRYGGSGWCTVSAHVGDLDGDGWPDIVLGLMNHSSWLPHTQFVLNNGDGTFRDATSQLVQTDDIHTGLPTDRVADFNGDGWLDLLLTKSSASQPGWSQSRLFFNSGSGHFVDVTPVVFSFRESSTYEAPSSEAADIDNDGDMDVITNWSGVKAFHIYRNMNPYNAINPRPLPVAPTLVSPANAAPVPAMIVQLNWVAVETATHYQLEVAEDSSFTQIVFNRDTLTGNYWNLSGLSGNISYFWRVKAFNTRGVGPWSSTWNFRTPQTVSISGRVTYNDSGLANVSMIGLPGNPFTDFSGAYHGEVELGWSGTVIPHKGNLIFIPESAGYSAVTADQQTNYIAHEGIFAKERAALIALYSSTNGDHWINNSGWKTPPLEVDGFGAYGSEGSWFGVTVVGNSVTRLDLSINNVDGTLPTEMGDLVNLTYLCICNCPLRGSFPESMANLTKLEGLSIFCTNISGSLPGWLKNAKNTLGSLVIFYNQLSGKLPDELGELTQLVGLQIQSNNFTGEIPPSLVNLTKLYIGNDTDFGYNGLTSSDAALTSFLNIKDPDWATCQTVAPAGISAAAAPDGSVIVSWTPIAYTSGTGGYRVYVGTESGGPYTFYIQTADKNASSQSVLGLAAGTPHYFIVQTQTDPRAENQNTILSEYSDEATATPLASIDLLSPNGGENWDAGSKHDITWTTAGTVGNVKLEYSTNNGGAWTTIIDATPSVMNQEKDKADAIGAVTPLSNSYAWILPAVASTTCLVRVSEAVDGALIDQSDAVFTITKDKPIIGLSKTSFNFAAVQKGKTTPPNSVLITNPGSGTLKWTAVSSQPWLVAAPKTGPADKTMKIKVVKAGKMAVGTYTGTITVADPNATNSPATINVTLVVKAAGTDSVPFGAFEKPADGATVNTATTAVSGWALDDVGMKWAKVYLKLSETKKKLIGTAKFIVGARPDIEIANPTYPQNNRAGWSYALAMKKLPNKGVGTFALQAYVQDLGGHQVLLGTHTITGVAPSSGATTPFGDLDRPEDGGTVSGKAFIVSGWALAPPPGRISDKGLILWIDGLVVGWPEYGLSRDDVETDYTGFADSAKAGGSFVLDTTTFADGWHTLAWSAADSSGAVGEIGSRYFKIMNGVAANDVSKTEEPEEIMDDPDVSPIIGEAPLVIKSLSEIASIAEDGPTPVFVRRGFSDEQPADTIYPENDGSIRAQIPEASRLVIYFNQEQALEGEPKQAARTERILAEKGMCLVSGDRSKPDLSPYPSNSRYRAYELVGDELRSLPICAAFDACDGILFWQAGPGFLGEHVFVIVDSEAGTRKTIRITIF